MAPYSVVCGKELLEALWTNQVTVHSLIIWKKHETKIQFYVEFLHLSA